MPRKTRHDDFRLNNSVDEDDNGTGTVNLMMRIMRIDMSLGIRWWLGCPFSPPKRRVFSFQLPYSQVIGSVGMIVWVCPPKPPTFWNSYTRDIDNMDTVMKLSGTIGVTQKKTMTFDTHVCLIFLHTWNPQERWGTHKKWRPSQPRPFAEVIGLVRCSYVVMN